jgi:RNA polymerase sigma-70 factor (ECF subfamily)
MDDADLIARAAEGDRNAFVTLVERHRRMVYRVAFQYAGNHHDADDIAQEVFIKMHRSLAGFRRDAQFTSWLYRVVMNACIDHSRRRTTAVSLGRPTTTGFRTAGRAVPNSGVCRYARRWRLRSTTCHLSSDSSSPCVTSRE